MIRRTLSPATLPASFVASRCALLKYAGTVTTASVTGSPRYASASVFSFWRIIAEISGGAYSLPSAFTRTSPFGPWTTSYGTIFISSETSPNLRPMKRLIEKIVFWGFVTCWRFAGGPTSRWPSFVNATTDGVVRPPSAFGMTVGSPPSSTAMQELVVPRSMPIVFAIFVFASVGLLRKSKPHSIKSPWRRKALVILMGLSLAAVAPAEGAKPPPPRLVRVSTDTTTTPGAQHATEVEPDAVAVGSKLVATYQVGRYFGGGAGAIGFATSTDAGRTWRSGLLPSLTAASSPPGLAGGASDPVVAYDALHQRWLVVSLSNFAGQTVLFVSGSPDGLAWEAPSIAIASAEPDCRDLARQGMDRLRQRARQPVPRPLLPRVHGHRPRRRPGAPGEQHCDPALVRRRPHLVSAGAALHQRQRRVTRSAAGRAAERGARGRVPRRRRGRGGALERRGRHLHGAGASLWPRIPQPPVRAGQVPCVHSAHRDGGRCRDRLRGVVRLPLPSGVRNRRHRDLPLLGARSLDGRAPRPTWQAWVGDRFRGSRPRRRPKFAWKPCAARIDLPRRQLSRLHGGELPPRRLPRHLQDSRHALDEAAPPQSDAHAVDLARADRERPHGRRLRLDELRREAGRERSHAGARATGRALQRNDVRVLLVAAVIGLH